MGKRLTAEQRKAMRRDDRKRLRAFVEQIDGEIKELVSNEGYPADWDALELRLLERYGVDAPNAMTAMSALLGHRARLGIDIENDLIEDAAVTMYAIGRTYEEVSRGVKRIANGRKPKNLASAMAKAAALGIARNSNLDGRVLASHVTRQMELEGFMNRATKKPYSRKQVSRWLAEK